MPTPEIDSLWNYRDPADTEAKFRELLARGGGNRNTDHAVQLLSQIARAQVLQRHYLDANSTLDEAESLLNESTLVGRIRCLLERGRLWNDQSRCDEARLAFITAYRLATEMAAASYAVDAAHMLGVLPPDVDAVSWNAVALEIARSSDDPAVRKWSGTLLMNAGCAHQRLWQFDESERCFTESLFEFQRLGNAQRERLARLCLTKTMRLRRNAAQALPLQLELLEQMQFAGDPQGYACEEIAESLLQLGRIAESRTYFRQAFEILSADPWFPPPQQARLERLGRLAAQ